MAKWGSELDLADYAPVAERIRLFYEAHPLGRIQTVLVSRTTHEVVFQALVYRSAEDKHPSATGWAAEREGDGDINIVACLENTETSAIGRALANLGFTASRHRPSAEEMSKSWRMRARLSSAAQKQRTASNVPAPREDAVRPEAEQRTLIDDDPLQRQANQLADALDLMRAAERLGLRSTRARSLRARIMASALAPDVLDRWSMLLRRWIDKRRTEALHILRAR